MPLQFKTTSTKHKADNEGELHAIKKLKTLHNSNNNTSKWKNEDKSDGPRKKQKFATFDEDDALPGSQWDGDNYSCAYNALFTILFNIWVSNSKKWKKIFKDSNQYLSTLHDSFQKYLTGVSTLEVAHCHTIKLFHGKTWKNKPYSIHYI